MNEIQRSKMVAKAALRELQYANMRDDMSKFGLCAPVHPERKKRILDKAIRASCLIPSGGRL